MPLPREQVKILVALDKHHRDTTKTNQLITIENLSRTTRLSLDRCGAELVLLNRDEYVEWYFHLGGPGGTQGHILQRGREAVQENYWVAKLDTLPFDFIAAGIPALVGFLLTPAAWQLMTGALVAGFGLRSSLRIFMWRGR